VLPGTRACDPIALLLASITRHPIARSLASRLLARTLPPSCMTMSQQMVRFHELARSNLPVRQRPSRSAASVRCSLGGQEAYNDQKQSFKPVQRLMAHAAAGVLLPAMLNISAVFPADAAVELSASIPLVGPLYCTRWLVCMTLLQKRWLISTFPAVSCPERRSKDHFRRTSSKAHQAVARV
jgi:hypothetical protein